MYSVPGMWTTALKTLPLASQETCTAMELYHNQLKVRLLNEKDPIVYQRADWLVDKLGTKVHSYFWLDEYSEKDDFARYWKDEWDSGLTAWRKSFKIPDLDVIVEGRCAKVTDQLDRDRVHVVWNPGSDFAICDCSWSEMGNICEHVSKVIRMHYNKGYRKSSISLFQFNKALTDMLYCPPHDSLIRDHAVSLAVAVQKQLDALVDFDSSHVIVDPSQNKALDNLEQPGGMNYANHDRELANECHLMEEDVSSHNKDDRGERNEGPGGVTSAFGESIREETTCAEMDIDPSSNCIPSSRLCPVDEVITSDVRENRDKTANDMGSSSKSPPRDEVLTDQAEVEHDSTVHMELQSIDIPPPLAEFTGQSVANQNDICNNDSELSVITNTSDADVVYNKASPPSSKVVEPQMIGMIATPGTTKNEATEPESENGSKTENHQSIDNTSSLNGVHDKVMLNPDCGHDPSAVDSMMESETLLNSSSTFNESDKHPPIEATVQETGSHEETSSNNNLVLTSCRLQKSAANGKGDANQSDIVDGSVAESIYSGGTVNVGSVASKGSDRCHEDTGVEASDV